MMTSSDKLTEVQKLYDNAATHYDRHNKDTTTNIARIMLLVGPKPDDRSMVLDNACGTGALVFSLLRMFEASEPLTQGFPKIHAVDISPAMIALVDEKSKSMDLPPGVLQTGIMDSQNLTFSANTFTHSYMNFGIFFLPDAERGASEIYRTLRPGGIAFISAWQSLGYLDLLQSAQKIIRPHDTGENKLRPMYSDEWFTEEKLRTTLIRGGFREQNIVVHRAQTALVGDDVDGLVETMLLPFGKNIEGWTEEERVGLRVAMKEELSEDQRRNHSVDMYAFIAVAVK
ncbi:S-adenosyl-L-methionine-dependent methyltransferase [Aspergillus granulosus]|uniref:S-adenosyl-L-methionine-dependent methyltransferase n=1 Tax=Aspergillus granulosus TaxID=176169 RepID=A0ABR4GVT9_9EURO